jgi:hypothetical protein
MSDTLVTVATLLTFAYLMANYKRQSVEAPEIALPLDELVDVRRYRHDGTQPPSQRVGNLHPAVLWPEVETLLS